jgi:hypothetical protein
MTPGNGNGGPPSAEPHRITSMPAATVFALVVNPATPLAQIESRALLETARVHGLNPVLPTQ